MKNRFINFVKYLKRHYLITFWLFVLAIACGPGGVITGTITPSPDGSSFNINAKIASISIDNRVRIKNIAINEKTVDIWIEGLPIQAVAEEDLIQVLCAAKGFYQRDLNYEAKISTLQINEFDKPTPIIIAEVLAINNDRVRVYVDIGGNRQNIWIEGLPTAIIAEEDLIQVKCSRDGNYQNKRNYKAQPETLVVNEFDNSTPTIIAKVLAINNDRVRVCVDIGGNSQNIWIEGLPTSIIAVEDLIRVNISRNGNYQNKRNYKAQPETLKITKTNRQQ